MPDAKTPRHVHTNRSAKADYLACKEILRRIEEQG